MPVLSLTLGGLLPAGNAVWCAWMNNGHLEPPAHGQGCELFFFGGRSAENVGPIVDFRTDGYPVCLSVCPCLSFCPLAG